MLGTYKTWRGGKKQLGISKEEKTHNKELLQESCASLQMFRSRTIKKDGSVHDVTRTWDNIALACLRHSAPVAGRAQTARGSSVEVRARMWG